MPKRSKIDPAKERFDIGAVPEIGTRWVHADCKRIVRVTKVQWFGGGDTGVVWGATIWFRYEKGSGNVISTFRRGIQATEQSYNIDDWKRLFSEPAPPLQRDR